MADWCTCRHRQPNVCPVHDAPGVDIWHICDVCCKAPHERAVVLREVLEPPTDLVPLGIPSVIAVTFFEDGWQLVESETAGETLLCPDHRLSLSKMLPKHYGPKRIGGAA